MSMNNIQTIGQEKHPKGSKTNIQYGTAGNTWPSLCEGNQGCDQWYRPWQYVHTFW